MIVDRLLIEYWDTLGRWIEGVGTRMGHHQVRVYSIMSIRRKCGATAVSLFQCAHYWSGVYV